jgi:hypothetical protein
MQKTKISPVKKCTTLRLQKENLKPKFIIKSTLEKLFQRADVN